MTRDLPQKDAPRGALAHRILRRIHACLQHRDSSGWQLREPRLSAMSMRMKLYDNIGAPNPRRVRMFLAEKGIEIPRVQISLMQLEQKREDFSAINPLQATPALEFDDGRVLTESIAICRYFEEVQPEPSLFGVGAMERAEVEMWQRRVEFKLFFAAAQVVRHSRPSFAVMENPQIAEWAEINRQRIPAFLDLLDRQLISKRFIAGERFSVADITAFCAVDFFRLARLKIDETLAHLLRWKDEVSARPSAAA